MGPQPPEQDTQPDGHIASLISEFFDRRKAGEGLTREQFVAEHPEDAETLQRHLADLSIYERACAPGYGTLARARGGEARQFPAVEGYELIDEIGRGGMGVVYKALQVATKRIVALKVLLSGPFASEAARRRFEREVELAARLRHPNIVSVLEGGRVADEPYYAMEYVAGTRLDRYLADSQPDVRTTLGLFVRICEAVEYAHRQGVIHRDLKPANVLIDSAAQVHIVDFGLAKATDQGDTDKALSAPDTLPGQILGTLSYLSPEQAAGAGAEIDTRTDVYSLGVMLFEALTGVLPYDTTAVPSEVIRRIKEAAPMSPSSLSDRVDRELGTIVLKALEKEKTRRYRSARELADDVCRYLEGAPILARQPGRLYVLRKKLRRHRLQVTLAATGAGLALMVVAAGVCWTEHQVARARRVALRTLQTLEQQEPAMAVGAAQALFDRHPEVAEAMLVQARALSVSERHNRRYRAGIAFLEDLLKRDPTRWACRALLGEFCRAAGDDHRAAVFEAQAERQAPDTAEAWYLRSFATLDERRALHCAQRAVQRDPSHALAWDRLVRLRMEHGDLDGALAGAEKLIELGEDLNEWTTFKGIVFAKRGDFDSAIQAYTQARAYTHLAHTYRRVRKYEKAVEYYDRLLGRAGERVEMVWLFYQRATPLWILGRTQEALRDYERVRRLLGRPSYGDARRYLMLRQQGHGEESQKVLDAALHEVEDDWLRQVLRCLNGELSADALVAEAVSRGEPEQLCEAYYYAGEVCLLAGDRAGAGPWFRRCVQTGVVFDPNTAAGTPMNEYELAEWRLETLFAKPSSAPTTRKSHEEN